MALGIDIGGSHITAALVDLESRSIVEGSWRRERVNSQGAVTDILNAWCAVINDVFGSGMAADVKYIGIGMPGPFDYEQGISHMKNQDKYDALFGLNVKTLLAEKLNIDAQHIRFINDAGCFLQGEAFSGAARGHQRAIGLTLGTGLGTAVFDGHLAKDADLWNAPFQNSIAEDYISTRWFVKRYTEISGNVVKDVKALVELMPTDARINGIFDEFAKNLAGFLTDFIRNNNPEVVVVGGNIANAAELFFPLTQQELTAQNIHVPLLKATLGESAAIIGAASVWFEQTVGA